MNTSNIMFLKISNIFSVKLNEVVHTHYAKAYVYNLDNIKEWKKTAPEMLIMVLSKYARH